MPKKLSLYKSVKTERGWRYCKAAFHSNAKVKPNIVLVNDVEEKHAEGSYFTLSDNQWVALGDDALDAQRKLMAMNAQREFQRLSQNPQQRESPVPAVSNGRKLICEEIERYLEGLVAAKRPAKSVRMNQQLPERIHRPCEEAVHGRVRSRRRDCVPQQPALDKGYERQVHRHANGLRPDVL